MPVEVGLWRIGDKSERIQFCSMDCEHRLETILAEDISILDPKLLIIGRQVITPHGGIIDLLAMDADGYTVVVELKKDKTPREVVAQVLDYASWVRTLQNDQIADIFSKYQQTYCPGDTRSLDQAFSDTFSVPEMPEELNEDHRLIIVASELDPSTERIVSYLSDEHEININAAFFRVFRDDGREYLCRAWLIDPSSPATMDPKPDAEHPWGGEYYVSFGGDETRDWEEARKYGFISAGGGSWYSKTLSILEKGARIWVNMPGLGYLGVGEVTAPVVPIDDFKVLDGQGHSVPIASIPGLHASKHTMRRDDPERAEHFVGVKWIKTVAKKDAIKEKGFFGNQNSAARPVTPKWDYTVRRLKQRFGIQ